MQLLKLTVLSSLLLALAVSFTSCEKDSEQDRVINYVKSGIVMTGAQETPATPSAAQGSLDVTYSKATKTLTYKFTWSGLADTITGIHIHGLAPTGYAAAIVQNILTTKNEAAFPFRGGSYSGLFYADGVKVKEEDLLNHFYYLNIHTKTYPSGEIRGQIRFQ
ncbi:MAG: CHRD domain-containing protein [Bacteroidota bacterium]